MSLVSRKLLAGALALVSACMSGCGSNNEDTPSNAAGAGNSGATVTFMTISLKPTFTDYVEGMIGEYEAANPGVTIDWVDVPYEGYETGLMTQLMAKDAADVVNLPQESVPNYVQGDWLLDLKPMLAEETLDSYVPALLERGGTFDGEVVALPWYVAPYVAFVNTAIMEEAGIPPEEYPRDLHDVPEIARRVRENTDAFGFFPVYTEAGALRGFLTEGGQEILNPDGTAAFNTPLGLEILQFWTDPYKAGLVPSEAISANHQRPIELFKTGKLALLFTGPQFLRKVKNDAPEVFANTEVLPRLQWPGVDINPVALHVLVVPRQTDVPERAADFAAFVTNGANQLELAKRTTVFPSVTSALEDPFFTETGDDLEGRTRAVAAKGITSGYVYKPPQRIRQLQQIFEDVMERVALGSISAQEGLAEAEERWNALVRQ